MPADPSVQYAKAGVTLTTRSKNTSVNASQYPAVSWIRNKTLLWENGCAARVLQEQGRNNGSFIKVASDLHWVLKDEEELCRASWR